MRALIIQHDHLCQPGFVGERLVERGYELEIHQVVPESRHTDPGVAAHFPDVRDFDLVVPLGSPWSAYDPKIASWVLPELQLLREADAADVPVLGICFGGQLLASAHGGTVRAADAPEIGWYDVRVADDQVPDGPWFHWHYDCWTVPEQAVELGRSANASQAFRLRRNLAVQFHPEIDEPILAGWLTAGGADEARAAGFDPDQLLDRTRQQTVDSRLRAHRLVDGFLASVAAG